MLTNDQKTNFLKQYSYCKERILILQERRKVYESNIYSIKVPSLSGLPHATDPHGLDDKLVPFLTQTEEIDTEIQILIKKMAYIKNLIQQVENMKYRSILEMRFIDGLLNKEVMSIIDKSYTVTQLHRRKAISAVNITEQTIEEYNNIK